MLQLATPCKLKHRSKVVSANLIFLHPTSTIPPQPPLSISPVHSLYFFNLITLFRPYYTTLSFALFCRWILSWRPFTLSLSLHFHLPLQISVHWIQIPPHWATLSTTILTMVFMYLFIQIFLYIFCGILWFQIYLIWCF